MKAKNVLGWYWWWEWMVLEDGDRSVLPGNPEFLEIHMLEMQPDTTEGIFAHLKDKQVSEDNRWSKKWKNRQTNKKVTPPNYWGTVFAVRGFIRGAMSFIRCRYKGAETLNRGMSVCEAITPRSRGVKPYYCEGSRWRAGVNAQP